MKPLPTALQTIYSNLVEAHLQRPAFDLDGAPFTRKLNNKLYWYANQRVAPGAPLKQKYLGPDTEKMRARIDQMREQRQTLADFHDYTKSLVAQLHAGGIRGPGRKDGPVLRALTNSGVFRLGSTLVGTHAFRHYDMVLGVLWDGAQRITETDDIDIASFKLSMAIEDVADPDIASALAQLGLEPSPTLDRKMPTSCLLRDRSYRVDFLTPSFRDEEAPVKLPALNMWAQGLHYLNFLISDPIDAVSPYMEGLLIKIPRPERYAVHKLIISQRRQASSAKASKDIEQARAIMWAMADLRPHELKTAIADADAQGEKWRAALDLALSIRFAPDKAKQHPSRDGLYYEGFALGQSMTFGISGSLAATLGNLEERRDEIEVAIQKKFRSEPGPDLMLMTYDRLI